LPIGAGPSRTGKTRKKDYTGHIPAVKGYFVISYKLMFIWIRRKIIPAGISRRVLTAPAPAEISRPGIRASVSHLIIGH
jgi:hypothetical protein